MGHIFVKFPDLLGLGRKEIIMLQKFRDLEQKVAVHQIDFVMVLLRFLTQILCILDRKSVV